MLLNCRSAGEPRALDLHDTGRQLCIVRFQLEETGATVTAAALDLMINGAPDQTVVLTPGVRRRSYSALLGPLSNGSHELRLQPATLWTWSDSLRVTQPAVEVVAAGDKQIDILSNAPAIDMRPDTIGTASDLPLLMYAEDVIESGARWLKYSVIFSNEDGGTPGVALMARWSRTTDIELAYEVEVRNGRAFKAGIRDRTIASFPRRGWRFILRCCWCQP